MLTFRIAISTILANLDWRFKLINACSIEFFAIQNMGMAVSPTKLNIIGPKIDVCFANGNYTHPARLAQ